MVRYIYKGYWIYQSEGPELGHEQVIPYKFEIWLVSGLYQIGSICQAEIRLPVIITFANFPGKAIVKY